MASLDEFNPGRWEAEDEDFLDREDNYVLQKSTNTLVTNVTAKTRTRPPRSSSHDQRISNGSSSHRRREPPSFASAKSLRKTHSSKRGSGGKRSSSTSRLSSTTSSKQHSSGGRVSPKPTVATAATATKAPQRVPSARKTPKPAQPRQSLPSSNNNNKRQDTAKNEPESDEESLDIVDVFPVLEEKTPPPKQLAHKGWQSQQIFIPTKQEKWNEASVMRMHQSMFSVHREESPYMKDVEFDDDDKSLSIEDVFPVLAESKTGKPKRSASASPAPSTSSGPAIIQAAKKANANRRWRTAGQKIAATTTKPNQPETARPQPPTTGTAAPRHMSAPPASFKPTPLVPLSARASSSAKPEPPAESVPVPPPPPTAAKSAPAPQHAKPPLPAKRTSPTSKVSALVNQFEHKAQESQETTASSDGGTKKPGYALPTYVAQPTASQKEDLQASDDLTMDSALLRSSTSSNHNYKEEQIVRNDNETQREERELMTSIGAAERQYEQDERLRQDETANKLERKRSKRSKKSSKKKKKKKSSKSSRRRLEHYASESSFTEQGRDRDTSLGPESIMEREEAEAARKRLKKERKERKKERKRKAKRAAKSERQLPTPKTGDREDVRMTKSMPEIEESQSSSPDDRARPSSRNMSESQPAISSRPALDSYLKEREGPGEPRGSTRRSLQSAQSSRKSSDSKRTSKSDGHIIRAQSSRQRRIDDDDDLRLDSFIRDGKKKAAETSSKMSTRSDSHTTVQRSNVAQKKPSHSSKKSSATNADDKSLKLDPDDFMRSAAAGVLYESEDSLSPGAAAAARNRARTAREESYRVASPSNEVDYGPSYRQNSAIKPAQPTKANFDKNVSPTWQQSSTSSSLSPSHRNPLKSSSSIRLPQKKSQSYPNPKNSPRHRGDSPVRRPDLMDNERMNSIGNFDMVSAVDAAVAAKKAEKQGSGKVPVNSQQEKKKTKKKKGLLKRVFGKRDSPKKKKPQRKSRSMPSIRESASMDVPEGDTDQAALNEYLSSSQSSWYSSPALEKRELASSAPSSPEVELPSDGALKYALGTPPGEKSR